MGSAEGGRVRARARVQCDFRRGVDQGAIGAGDGEKRVFVFLGDGEGGEGDFLAVEELEGDGEGGDAGVEGRRVEGFPGGRCRCRVVGDGVAFCCGALVV